MEYYANRWSRESTTDIVKWIPYTSHDVFRSNTIAFWMEILFIKPYTYFMVLFIDMNGNFYSPEVKFKGIWVS